jgi:hypothetical protein
MPRQKNIFVIIKLKRNLLTNDNVFGWCLDMGDKEYEIEVDSSADLVNMLTTVAHEMVHVKQYARGEHAELARGVFRWKRKYYSMDTDYEKMPWEKQAHKLEKRIWEEWSNINL